MCVCCCCVCVYRRNIGRDEDKTIEIENRLMPAARFIIIFLLALTRGQFSHNVSLRRPQRVRESESAFGSVSIV